MKLILDLLHLGDVARTGDENPRTKTTVFPKRD
jgi:hypothetical protein